MKQLANAQSQQITTQKTVLSAEDYSAVLACGKDQGEDDSDDWSIKKRKYPCKDKASLHRQLRTCTC
jgi:hypothetical protein